ncbi:c-type cytochrome [Thiomicrorhabdus aquaedulcis]|uniref:c-type cytochrome n=1 Tax=Thiomicrorhabdus aquaedulcis TaxID=2211106 RepID=UPI001E3B1189|nr:c-type cytochrome [Thiomicrorhabdus aquaedulcis]
MTLHTLFTKTAPKVVTMAVLSTALLLSACSDDKTEPAQTGANNAMDVKQPVPESAKVESLQQEPASRSDVNAEIKEAAKEMVEDVKVEAKEMVSEAEEVVKEVKAEAKEMVASASGASDYATCVGCHGANAEGGVGPRLNNQPIADIVAKLEKYKAGEQVGPMTGMMAPMAAGLSTATMESIAQYVVTLK